MKLPVAAGLLVSVVVAVAITLGVTQTLGDVEPVGTPPPPSGMPDLPPRTEEELIPLYEPIPYPIPIQVGPKTVVMPKGSVLEDEHNDPGGRFMTVSRGKSKVVFDGESGVVLEWSVAPEDAADFAPLRLP